MDIVGSLVSFEWNIVIGKSGDVLLSIIEWLFDKGSYEKMEPFK